MSRAQPMILSKLLDKKILMVTGKGGIGKSLLTASLGLFATQLGKRVCLVESNAEDQLGPLLGVGAVGHKLTFCNDRLAVINLDANLNFRDFIVLHLGFAKVFEQIFEKPLVQSFVRMIPGIAEVTLLGRLFFHSCLDQEHKFDLVIFDGFASGHFKSLMATPDAILNSGFVGPIITETQRVRDYIYDHKKCGILVAAAPEALILSETLEFVADLKRDCKVEVSGLVINRYLSPLTDLADSPPPVREYLCRKIEQCSESLAAFMSSLEGVFPDLLGKVTLLDELFQIADPLDKAEILAWLEQGHLWQQMSHPR